MSFESWDFAAWENTLRHYGRMRGVSTDSPTSRFYWSPLPDTAAGRAEFLRRVRVLTNTDDAALFGDDRVRGLVAYARGLQDAIDREVLAAGGAA
jgi:hypothetical protein